jgi:pantetheine-phosphate adenylyltransferase
MARKYVRALFPGSFDPITNGHLDVIRRAVVMFDELIVAIGDSPKKEYLFTGEQRLEMARELLKDVPDVTVHRFTGLTIECARSLNAQVILRGLRNMTDVQYEFQIALTNRSIAGIETVFIMTGEQYGFTSSTLIREVARYGGDVSGLVPESVCKKLREKLKADNKLTIQDF